jgi:hypothetical protein
MRLFLKRALAVSIAVLLAACQGASTVAPKLEHRVGEALEGVYYVGWGSLERTYDIGTLKLRDGQYSFTPVIPVEQIPRAAIDRLFFVKSPEGQYNLKYQDAISENTLLEELNDFTFLVLIQFFVPVSTSGEMQYSNGMFFIASSQESKSLLFHSFYNELQQWGVGKSWD